MEETKYSFLPIAKNNLEANNKDSQEINRNNGESVILAGAPCPCCGYITIPNHGDALAYICPVCFWEIDLFIKSRNEPSDQNHGITLNKASENYIEFGAVLPRLRKYCRSPKDCELPTK